ncbi:ATP-binding cassette domain-containing protein [Microbacterium sp. ABRD28]|uniref:ABC transporter ATP-binding protein/permease n=1 Tax=Microbacterium sp. ABRD28 TaxID=2268461 RepID=UPI000F54CF4A|nr:ATP-binding cassette domain-containing protein [Microbacterium sp. ABRD28]AZC12387.1 ATP-binding cassette domain-containing protein [Microbacterium sp. ABRD28]
MIHRRLLELAGVVPGVIVALSVIGLAVSALHLGFALALGLVIGDLVNGGADLPRLLTLLLLIAVVRALLIWVRETVAARLGTSVRITLRARLLDRLVDVPSHARDSGAIATTVIDGVEGLAPYFTRYLPQLLVVMVVPLAAVVAVWQQAPVPGMVLAAAAAVAVLAPRAWDARLLRNGRGRWARFARLSSDYVEALQNIPLLRSFGAGRRTGESLRQDADGLRDATMVQLRLSLAETGVSALARLGGTVLTVVAAVAALAGGEIGATQAIVILMLTRECFRPVQELGEQWHAGYVGLTAVDGLEELLTTPHRARRCRDEAVDATGVECEDVSYYYPGGRRGVAGLSLRIAPGECLAVIGPSGSGKSTIARLLERDVDPDAGTIRVGDVDLRALSDRVRAATVAVVPQDPVLFAWTIADNLRLCRPAASDSEVEAAARIAQIHDVIRALPDGYRTILDENGEQLSGGERQRLALARALLSPAPVLVLDEVTSALDPDTERALIDAVHAATAQRTVVIIAHRSSACRHATRWLLLRDGSVAASGAGSPASAVFEGAGAW